MSFKPGDTVMFTSDIRSEPQDGRKLKIPRMVPCTIERMNKHHIWVKYNGKTIWLRLKEDRMIPATESGIILFGDKECIETASLPTKPIC
jgi:hypothetical protein